MKKHIEFNPGHRSAIEGFLNESSASYTPQELAEKAEAKQKVEDVLYILRQETGNTAMLIDYLFMLVEDIEQFSANLTDDNIEQLLGYLEEYVKMTRQGSENVPLIVQCVKAIELLDEQAQQAGRPTLLTGESVIHIDTAVKNFEKIQKTLDESGEKYDQIYQAAVAKVKTYLGE